jgi:P27 family predicted phage terminase small subunit
MDFPGVVGMSGPPKLPLEERRLRGRSAGRDSGGRALPDPANVVALHGVDGGLPAVPSTLTPDGPGAGRWRRIWGECTWLSPQTDLDVVTRLCEQEDLYAGMKAALADEGFYVTGSMGQKRTNPLLGDLRATADQMLKLEKEIGLTPAARGSMGVAEVKGSGVVENNPLMGILERAAGRGQR